MIVTGAQNPRSLVNLLDKNAKQKHEGGTRHRTHDVGPLSKHSSFIHVAHSSNDEVPQQAPEQPQ